jgi:hypothetical protein
MRAVSFVLTTTVLSTLAHADSFTTPAGWSRPASLIQSDTDRTTYQRWDAFNTYAGLNAPVAPYGQSFNAAGTPDAGSSTFSLVTGGGNLYSPFSSIRPFVDVPLFTSGVNETTFHVQLRVTGSTMDPSQLAVDLTDDDVNNGVLYSTLANASYSLPVNIVDTFTPPGETVPQSSYTQEHLWTFTITGNPALVRLDFGAWPAHASLDVVAVDTVSVPEPAMLGVISFGAIALRRRAR